MIDNPVRVGVIGCGNISDAYFKGLASFPQLRTVACADLDLSAAEAKAETYGLRALSVDALLADPDVEVVVNLTVPKVHAEVSRAILASGKHAYSEKPLATTLADGRALMEEARAAGLMVGCAPDTFLGAGHQEARAQIDAGTIGRPLSGALCVMSRGMEDWHPNPRFFFERGAGPLLDVCPYYIVAAVNLLGRVARVSAMAGQGYPVRTVTSEPRRGEEIAVEVPTTVLGTLQMESGALVTLNASWDVWAHARVPIEIYGTRGSMLVPDPNFFAGPLKVNEERGEWREVGFSQRPFGEINMITNRGEHVANYRAVGVADFAMAIREGREARASGALALHTLEVLESLERAAEEGRHVDIESRPARPDALRPEEFAGENAARAA